MITRREFGAVTIGSLALSARASAQTAGSGVRIGVQTYSFRDLPRTPGGDGTDAIVRAMSECGLQDCELWAPQIEPAAAPAARGTRPAPEQQQQAREALRRWRIETPVAHFQAIRDRFAAAGHSIYGYNYSFNAGMNDAEIDRGFEIARALGAEIITASTTLTVAKRRVPFAEKHQMVVAMHNHSNLKNPDEFATPGSFAAALEMSRFFKVNLDIGHFTAANFDPVAYLRQHHASVTNLHLKDRRRDQGDNTPWGQGDTPIREVLQLVRNEGWPIRAHVEYEYRGDGTPVDEVRKCVAYVRQALA